MYIYCMHTWEKVDAEIRNSQPLKRRQRSEKMLEEWSRMRFFSMLCLTLRRQDRPRVFTDIAQSKRLGWASLRNNGLGYFVFVKHGLGFLVISGSSSIYLTELTIYPSFHSKLIILLLPIFFLFKKKNKIKGSFDCYFYFSNFLFFSNPPEPDSKNN